MKVEVNGIRLFNTLHGGLETFRAEEEVGLYVCGVTPYDTTHVGHARTYLVFDVLIRHLIHHGFKINYIQNITDVDESILKRASEVGEPYDRLGDRYTITYIEDVANLGMIPAATYPRATDAIPYIQEVIRRLLATGHAYRTDGDVYFRIASTHSYGRLSRLGRDEMLRLEAQQDASTVEDPRKEDPLDFPLWISAGQGGPSWGSPWGPGRPGWHIECSTLALKHLGKQVDIHGGGEDLKFPHHEAEIAQAEAVTGVRPFARFWVHVAMALCNGEKMSKSKGNMVFVRDVLGRYRPDALRLYLLGTHYREPLDFDEPQLRGATDLTERIVAAASAPASRVQDDVDVSSLRARFEEALDDDLDTPAAIEVLSELAERVLTATDAAYQTRRALRELASRLGLSLVAPR